MGTIVINQTDSKQNVVLESSLDGIAGGYYDAAGVWHEIGAGMEIPEIKVYLGKGISSSTGEETENAARASSDPIPFSGNDTKIQLYFPASKSFYVNLKLYKGEEFETVIRPTVLPYDAVGTTASEYTGWANIASGHIVDVAVGTKLVSIPDMSEITSIRMMFKIDIAGTDNVAGSVFDGYIVVGGQLYHLINE